MSGKRTRSWGEFVEDIADERALMTFSGTEPLTTAEIAEEMNTTEHTARGKLEALASKGALESKVLREETAPLTVWYLPRDALVRGTEADEEIEDPLERADDLIECFDVPGTSSMMHNWRRDAIRAAYEYLRERVRVPADEFREEVYPSHAASYDESQAWWAMVRDRLKQLPGVVGPTWGGETWSYEEPTAED
jgi:predicted transcriptional regulator